MAKRTKHYNPHRADGLLDETGGSAELYNDDISRKAVGRLFNDDVRVDEEQEPEEVYPEDEYAASVEEEQESVADDLSYRDYINSVSEFGGDSSRRGGGRDATKSPAYKKITVPRETPVYPKTPRRYEPEPEREQEREYDEDEAESGMLFGKRLPVDFKLIAYAVGGVMLIVLCFLIFKINSNGSQLKQLQAEADAAKEIKSQNQALIIEKEDLQNRVDALTMENDVLTAQLEALHDTAPTAAPAQPDDGEPSEAPADNPPASAGEQKYVVVEGDNFWKIAMKFYGDGNRAEEIMKANNIDKPEHLKIGTILLIP